MTAKFIKLTTGEEIVADVSEEKNGMVSLKNPVKMMMTKEGIGIMPSFPACKNQCMDGKSIKLEAKYIMLVLDLDEDIYNAYNSEVGGGIVLPTTAQTMKIVKDDQ